MRANFYTALVYFKNSVEQLIGKTKDGIVMLLLLLMGQSCVINAPRKLLSVLTIQGGEFALWFVLRIESLVL